MSAVTPLAGGPRTWSRTLVGGIWLFYLVDPLQRLLVADAPWRVVGLLALAAFAVLFLVGLRYSGPIREPARAGREMVLRIAVLVGLLACVALMVPGAGDQAMTGMVFVAALSMGSLAVRPAWCACVTVFAVTELSLRLVPGWEDNGSGLAVVLASLAVWGFRTAAVRQRDLVEAERELAAVRVQEERSRIARDLHDILGHSLTVVTVKAELARRLLDVDPTRAREELADLERLSRDALSDVRQTALGVRGVSLPAEIASARSALTSAGIDPVLPTVADEVPTDLRDLYAWTVREAVTNVVRHSGATTCSISMTPTSLEVVDDGGGTEQHAEEGHGLDGLRHRAQAAGARLTTGTGPGGRGFRLRLDVTA